MNGINLKKKIPLWSVILFVIGAVQHSAYPLLGKPWVLALLAPTDESIFQHGKLFFVPVTIWWIVIYVRLHLAGTGRGRPFLNGALACAVFGTLLMPMTYYFYAYGLGIHNLALDIFLLLFCDIAGMYFGAHVSTHCKKGLPVAACYGGLILLWGMYIVFSFWVPGFPIFA